MTLEELNTLGAFDAAKLKVERKVAAISPETLAVSVSWPLRKAHYIEQLGYTPTPRQFAEALITDVGGKPHYGLKRVKESTLVAIASALATVTGEQPAAYFPILQEIASPTRTSTGRGLYERYQQMLQQGYNDVDAALYSKLMWTTTEGHTESIILLPVGQGSEYLPLCMDPDDLYSALPSLATPEGTDYETMLEYVDSVQRRMVASCNQYEMDDPSALDGIPASALDTVIKLVPVREGKEILGFELKYNGGKYPDVKDWIKASMRKWLGTVAKAPIPQPISNDPTVPTYCYRDLSVYVPGEFPTITSWMQSVSYEGEFDYNIKTLAMYAYISNVAANECKQVLWMHGAGADAKSPLTRALTANFGHHAGALDLSSGSDHATTQIVGKVMLTVADSKNPNTLRDKMVQKITGRDLVHINPKGGAMYSITSVAKMIVTENIYPYLTCHDRGQVSRLLLIDLRSRSTSELIELGLMHVDADGTASFKGDPAFRTKVAAEAVHYIHYGKQCWEELGCPNNLPVPKHIRERIEDMCSPPEDTRMYRDIQSWLCLEPESFVLREDLHDMLDHYYAPRIPDASRVAKVLDYLYDGTVVIKQRRIGPGRQQRVFAGVGLTKAGQVALESMLSSKEAAKSGDDLSRRLPPITAAQNTTTRNMVPRSMA